MESDTQIAPKIEDPRKIKWYVVFSWTSFLIPVVMFVLILFGSLLGPTSPTSFVSIVGNIIGESFEYVLILGGVLGFLALIMRGREPKQTRSDAAFALAITGVILSIWPLIGGFIALSGLS